MREPMPYFVPLTGDPPGYVKHDSQSAVEIASREQMARDAALGRSPLPPRPVLQIKEPLLPDDFQQKRSELDKRIAEAGIKICRDRLISLGRERFEKLLAADHKCRFGEIGAGVDLTRFDHVAAAISAFECQIVPPRKSSEQLAGSGKDREAVRQIAGWDDLWKATHERREVIDAIYNFHDEFERLCFGHELAEALSPSGRATSPMFRGGKRNVNLFIDWLPAVEGELVQVKLSRPLWSIMAWLANEKGNPPDSSLLAREFWNVRAPSPAQELIAAATVEGFLLGLDDWMLWDYVGKSTRTAVSETRLAGWHKILAKRYRAISEFHRAVNAAHMQTRGYGFEAHFRPDRAAARAFIDRTTQQLLDVASALLALGIEENFAGAVIARFQGALLVDAKHELKDKRVHLSLPLAKAFPHASFDVQL
jgi:hypothetical protein